MATAGKQGKGSKKNYSTSRNKDGSLRVLRKAKNVRALRRQARSIKENQLKRKLPTGTLVGHKDHTRKNNNPSNLVLTNQKKHQKSHPGKKGSREATKRGHK